MQALAVLRGRLGQHGWVGGQAGRKAGRLSCGRSTWPQPFKESPRCAPPYICVALCACLTENKCPVARMSPRKKWILLLYEPRGCSPYYRPAPPLPLPLLRRPQALCLPLLCCAVLPLLTHLLDTSPESQRNASSVSLYSDSTRLLANVERSRVNHRRVALRCVGRGAGAWARQGGVTGSC